MNVKLNQSISLVSLGLLMNIILLSGCKTISMKGECKEETHTEGNHQACVGDPVASFNNVQQKDDHDESFCPNCKEGSRYLYKLADEMQDIIGIILICEECNSIWINPQKIAWGDTASDNALANNFNVSDSELLFNDKSGWATEEEVKKSKWDEVAAKNNTLIVKSSCETILPY